MADGDKEDEITNKKTRNRLKNAITSLKFLDPIGAASTKFTDLFHKLADALSHSEGVEAAGELFLSLPIVSSYVRGLNYLREAYVAIRDPATPQRKTKIAAGLFGGLISIGAGTLAALFITGTGLLATSAAVYALPIVIAACTVGVYSVAFYRDTYIFLQKSKKLEKAILGDAPEHEIVQLEREKKLGRSKMLASAVCAVAVGLVLTAVCMTGVGAAVVGILGSAIFITSTCAKIYFSWKEGKAKKAAPAELEMADMSGKPLKCFTENSPCQSTAKMTTMLENNSEPVNGSTKAQNAVPKPSSLTSSANVKERPVAALASDDRDDEGAHP